MHDILVNIIDERAKTDPEALYAKIPKSSTSFDEGYIKITYKSFTSTISRVT